MGEVQRDAKCYSGRCDNFVEQREHRSVAPCVVDVNEHGGTIAWTQSFVAKSVSGIEVMSDLVSRRDHCAQTAPFHRPAQRP
jgi:hypothetical protein